MKVLSINEVEEVSGGDGLPVSYAAATTIGLMALAPASVLVVTGGLVAMAFYSAAYYYS